MHRCICHLIKCIEILLVYFILCRILCVNIVYEYGGDSNLWLANTLIICIDLRSWQIFPIKPCEQIMCSTFLLKTCKVHKSLIDSNRVQHLKMCLNNVFNPQLQDPTLGIDKVMCSLDQKSKQVKKNLNIYNLNKNNASICAIF